MPSFPIGFAHRGARDRAPDNTLEGFRLALALGAGGLESDAWLSADGTVVLDHDGLVGSRWRRTPIRQLRSDELPSHIPALRDLYELCGTSFELSLDVKDPASVGPILQVARAAGPGAVSQLWLCHPDPDFLAQIRRRDAQVRLVHSTSARRLGRDRPAAPRSAVMAHAATDDARCGIDALNLRADEWGASDVGQVHQAGVLAFAWDAQRATTLDRLLQAGVDAVYSDHVELMVGALDRLGRA